MLFRSPLAHNIQFLALETPKGNQPKDMIHTGGMFIWYFMARMSQAYTLVANYATGNQGNFGQSGLYSLVPEAGFYAPRPAPANANIAHLVNPARPAPR